MFGICCDNINQSKTSYIWFQLWKVRIYGYMDSKWTQNSKLKMFEVEQGICEWFFSLFFNIVTMFIIYLYQNKLTLKMNKAKKKKKKAAWSLAQILLCSGIQLSLGHSAILDNSINRLQKFLLISPPSQRNYDSCLRKLVASVTLRSINTFSGDSHLHVLPQRNVREHWRGGNLYRELSAASLFDNFN